MVRVLVRKYLSVPVLRWEELFDAVREEVLTAREVPVELRDNHLRPDADDKREDIKRQTRGTEIAYEQAVSRARLEVRLRRRLVAAGAVVLFLVLAVAVASGWSDALKDALTHDRAVSVKSAVGMGLATVVLMVLIAAGAAFVPWCVYYLLSRDVRAGVPAAKGRQLLISAGIPYGVVTLFCAILAGVYPTDVVWQLRHDRPLEDTGAYGWGAWFTLGALVLAALPPLSLRRLASEASGQRLSLTYLIAVLDTRERKQAEQQAEHERREAVEQALSSFIREGIRHYNTLNGPDYSTTLTSRNAPGLRQLRADREHVPTRADRQLAVISEGMEGGSIAVSGPRGVGKTQLLWNFCKAEEENKKDTKADKDSRSRRLSLIEPVPVLFDRREFMLHLFYKLCELVIREGLHTAPEAERHKRSIRYLQTQSDEAGLSAGWWSWNLSARKATSLAEQPQSYPEIVDALKRFLGRTALELDTAGRRLVIGIDELDRIEPAATARTFLNELKAVFDVPKCLFVLSVSDEALREAELAPVGRRDAFDSAIDEVVRVEPLDQATAERLLGRRVVGLPTPFAALFYCLSGGMPRDLLRTARAAFSYLPRNVSVEQPYPLTDVTLGLTDRELNRIANAAGGADGPTEFARLFRPDAIDALGGLGELGNRIHQQAGTSGERARIGATLANRAYHLDTVQRIFTTDLTKKLIEKASELDDPRSFSVLARAQREIGTADTLARESLQRVRKAWSLPVPPAVPDIAAVQSDPDRFSRD